MTTPVACPLRVAVPPLKGQCLRPGKAGSTALSTWTLARMDVFL
jgi:hypothetical protein